MQSTFETRVRVRDLYPLLDAMADLYGRAERSLYVDRHVRRRPLNELKREYQGRFGITARQFNAISFTLDGKVRAARETLSRRVTSLERRAGATRQKIQSLEEEQGGAPTQRIRFILHQKRRRLGMLEGRLQAARREAVRQAPGIAFGGRRLFHAQFHLAESGYASHEAWLREWRKARASQFFCLGSKDETAGNQSASRLPGGNLRLRLPHALAGHYGRWVVIPDVRFRYGQDAIDRALATGQAISYRFVRRQRKGRDVWYIKATTDRPAAGVTTNRALGALGVDLNPHLVAVGKIDRYGNPTATRHIPVAIQGRRTTQVEAALGDAVAAIVAWAKEDGVPIVVERLDFEKKKAALREESPRRARMLSSFAYRKFHALLLSRCGREGVEVILVNPAFTSVIGMVKFASGYGLSPHAAAAVAVARRGLGFGERLRSRSALPLPARTRGRHVWSDWGRLARRLRSEKLHNRRPSEGDRGGGTTLSLATGAMPSSPGERTAPVPG